MKRVSFLALSKVLLLACSLAGAAASGQNAGTVAPAQNTTATDATALYRDLLNPVIQASDVHQVRDVSLRLEDINIVLSDGTVGLLRAPDGQLIGAVFEGNGEVLVVPPDRAERTSLLLFTGSGVLEENFTSAYLRFVDERVVRELQAGLRPAEDIADFITRWEQPLKYLARTDALQVLRAINNAQDRSSRFLRARIGGTRLGAFDVVFDASAPEQIAVAQEHATPQASFYNSWMSFPMRSVRLAEAQGTERRRAPRLELSDYRVRVQVHPPTDLSIQAELTMTPHVAEQRTVILELSRYLRVSEIKINGQSLPFIQNQAMSGSELARRGDDLIAIVFPTAMEKDKPLRVSFTYSGPVMFNTGGELLYVGARGTWYPNIGPSYCNYDLTFDYPDDWTLVATGKQMSSSVEKGRRVSRFVSEKPIARAGFNLGKFEIGNASVGDVVVHAYAAANVERELAGPVNRAGKHPLPSREVRQIAERAAASVRFLSDQLDPFPYSNLEITQLPGLLSQSWPGLIYLSSMAFLDRDERVAVGVHDPYVELLLSRLMLAHETAHQWWGDAVDWVSYRDEWIIEALANYSALMMLEKEDPQAMRTALDYYKAQLLKESSSGIMADAGSVTLGVRLTSSKFPDAYERVLYGRGTWLIHTLRTMLREAGGRNDDALFFAALKKLLARSPNHKISTGDLRQAFEDVLPDSLAYEGKKSLEWYFDSWINGSSIPQLSLADVHLANASGKVKVTATIEQTKAAKDTVTAVPIYAVDESGKSHFLAFVFADENRTNFTLTAPAGTKEIQLDPESTILRR